MPGQCFTFGPFLLNPQSGTLLRDGEPLAIGGRGARLLEALLKCPGEVVTKADLMDAAWPGTAVEESNLSVQIAAIRKLLGPLPDGSEWIATIPRIGYRFVGVCQAAESGRTSATRPAKPTPSLAVLPFANIGGDPDQEVFADGLAEDIITALSKLSGLLVIARNSSFAYKGRSVDLRQVAKELAVRYVLEGSVRRSASRVQVTVQLNDAESGAHIWAEGYDRELADIFAVQDDVTRQIVGALNIKLGPTEAALLAESGTTNVEALACFQVGWAMLRGSPSNPVTLERSNTLFRRAIEIDPNYPEPYACLGMGHVVAYRNNWNDDPDQSLLEAEAFVAQALKINPNNASAHFLAGQVASCKHDFATWRAEIDKVLSLNPNSPGGHLALGQISIYAGRPLSAIAPLERARRLDPIGAPLYIQVLGLAHLVAGEYGAAAALFKERILLTPEADFSRAYLAATLGHLGDIEEARRIWEELKTINPNYSFTDHMSRQPWNEADVARIAQGLSKAGLLD